MRRIQWIIALSVLVLAASCGSQALNRKEGAAQRQAATVVTAEPDAKCQETGTGTMILPDDGCTPGVHATVDEHIACTASLHPRKDPTTAQRHRAFRDYGIPYSQHSDYEIDHRIPVFLRGQTTVKNLWPEPDYAHASGGGFIHNPKDALESFVYKAICWSHSMTVDQALKIFEGNWVKAYNRLVVG